MRVTQYAERMQNGTTRVDARPAVITKRASLHRCIHSRSGLHAKLPNSRVYTCAGKKGCVN